MFKSEKMWDTCWKLGLSIIGIGMAYMLDVCVLPNLGGLNLANFFAAFIVGTEFWSFLENSAIISNHPYSGLSGRTWRDQSARRLK